MTLPVRPITASSPKVHLPAFQGRRRQPTWLLIPLIALAFYAAGYGRAQAQQDELILPIAINLGTTNAYTAGNGTIFMPDQVWQNGSYGYVNGAAMRKPDSFPIAGTNDPALYRSKLKGWTAYRFDNMPDGTYAVVLHFAEVEAHGPGQSIFDVVIEEQPVLEELDLFRAAGLGRAYVRRFLVDVSDGTLNIDSVADVGSTQMAAIEVHPVNGEDDLLMRPQDVQATPSFDAVILTWSPSSNPIIDGYYIYRSPNLDGPFTRITDRPVTGASNVDLFSDQPSGTSPSFDRWHYQLSTVDLFGNESDQTDPVSARPLAPEDAPLPVYNLEISEENLATLQSDVLSDVEVPALIIYEGQPYPADVRFRGHISRFYPKKSWKIIFPTESPVEPRDRLNLRSQYKDPSLLRSGLTNWLYDEAGIQPPASSPALLYINGEYAGLYDDAEEVDRRFLERTGRSADADIYAAKWTPYGNWGSLLNSVEEYHAAFSKETNRGTGYGDLISFFEMINGSDERSFASQLGERLEVKRFLDYYAVIVLTQNMDFTRHNVFLIHDLDTDRWEVVPWDPDFTWGIVSKFPLQLVHDLPLDMGTNHSPDTFNGPNTLLTHVIEVPQFRAYYCSRLQELATNSMSGAQMGTVVDDLHAQIADAGRGDWHKFGGEYNDWFDGEPERIKYWSDERRDFLLGEIDEYCDVQGPFLAINEVMPDNVGAICDPDDPEPAGCTEPWIEIFNAGLESASLEGLILTSDHPDAEMVRINHPIKIPPLSHAIIWLDDEPDQGANHIDLPLSSLTGSVSLIAGDGQTLIDKLTYELTPPDRSYGRFPDAADESNLLSITSPGSRNRSGPYVAVIEPATTYAAADVPIHISAEIGDDGTVTGAALSYAVNDQPWQTVQMSRIRYGRYEVDIASQPPGSQIQYFIIANDDDGFSSRSPSMDPQEMHMVTVGYQPPSLRISRFSTPPDSNNEDTATGWIELHNYGKVPVNIADMYLSNQSDNTTMFLIPSDIVLEPNDYFTFSADGNADIGPTHTNFTLNPTGGMVALFDANQRFNRLIDLQRYGDEISGAGVYACPTNGTTWIASAPTINLDDEILSCRSIFLPMVH